MGNTCKPMAVSFKCMTKSLQIKHTHTHKKKKKKKRKMKPGMMKSTGLQKV